jgi:hypothetical protein
MAETKDKAADKEAPAAEEVPAEELISDPGTTLAMPMPEDHGITDPGTTLGVPVEEKKKSAKEKEAE